MATLTISSDKVFKNKKGNSFLLLGSETIPSSITKSRITKKINKTISTSIEGVWATLGSADDSEIFWEGTLQFSKNGNVNSSGVTLDEVKILQALNEDILNKTGEKIVERYINFDEIDFKLKDHFTLNEIPKLRLTLFLKKTEGATVFYELYDGKYDPAKNADAEIEYIQPCATENFSTDRDRLTYLFDMLPSQVIETKSNGLFGLLSGSKKMSFVLKILTFPRDNKQKDPDKIIATMVRKFLPEKDHRLLFYNSGAGIFIDTNGNTSFKINTSLKTLLLIHGTFSSTEKSFTGIIEKQSNGRSWLQDLIIESDFQQVLAFDHPTIVADAKTNVAYLQKLLNGATWHINNPVTLLTTSRGGLVGKYLLTDADMQKNVMPVKKAIMIACANGSHYFDAGEHVAKFFSLLKSAMRITGGMPFIAGISALAQFSAEYFLSRPGSLQMKIGHPSLTELMQKKPIHHDTLIYPIVDDWDPMLTKENRWLKRISTRGLDKLLKIAIFKKLETDWVIAVKNQEIMPTGFSQSVFHAKSMHTQVLHEGKSNPNIQEEVKRILLK